MNAFKIFTDTGSRDKNTGPDAWHRALKNKRLRLDCPDAYHDELVRHADQMDRLGIVICIEWRDLRVLADQAYLRAVALKDYQADSAKNAARIDHGHR